MSRTLSTERLARASAAHPKLTLVAWLGAFMATSAAIAVFLGSSLTTGDDFTNRPESQRAEAIADAEFGRSERSEGFRNDVTVVVHAPEGGNLAASVEAVSRRLEAIPPAEALDAVRHDRSLVSEDGRTALIQLDLGFASDGFVERLVDTVGALNEEAGYEVAATGERIVDLDLETTAEQDLIRGEVIGLTAALIVLLVVFGSLVASLVPLAVAIVSIVVAQHESIEAWLPLFLFSVLFGLSMDYNVFLVSRIRERWLETGDTTDAVAFGVRLTGRIITGAALIMVAVFAGFATGDLVMFQQMGFGLGVAVLLDATVVRCVLVPAAMKLLGGWNWWLPRRLAWLPGVGVEGRSAVEEGGAS